MVTPTKNVILGGISMDMRSERLFLNITFDRVYDDEPSQMKSLGMVVPILTND